MRISTAMMYDASVSAILKADGETLHTQLQLSTGKRILEPADDPLAASEAVGVTARKDLAVQYAGNLSMATSKLELAEAKLGDATGVLQDARTLLIQAGDGSLTNADRASLVTQLQGLYQQLLVTANSADAQGRYLFAGFKDAAPPFSETPAGVTYTGDQGQRLLAVSESMNLAISDNGNSIFERGRTGNGAFSTAAAAGNTGTGFISVGSVYDATQLTGDQYQVVFNVAAGTTTYDVLDTTLGTTVSAGNAYASGQSIRVDGMDFSVSGQPAAGDTFSAAPSASQSVFTALSNAIAAVATPAPAGTGQAQLTTSLGRAVAELDSSLDRILTVRSAFGATLGGLDTMNASNSATQVTLASRLSVLQDVDVAKAASDLQRQQLVLQAAEHTHAMVAGMSLFNYIG